MNDAPGVAPPPPNWDDGTFGDPELNRLLRKWQKRLRLEHWDLRIRYARHHELEEDTGGSVNQEETRLAAVIFVLLPADYDTSIPWPHDVERIVVHELLHLWVNTFADMLERSPDNKRYIGMEQTINVVCDLLVALDRGEPDQPRE